MKQKLGNILLIMLLITASLQIMTFQKSNTLADPGAGGSEDGYLDFDYYFDTVSYLSNIIHNSSIYDPSEIKKGRYFGSDGDKAAAKYLKDNFINNSGFDSSDVRKVSMGDVQDASYDHDYTEFVNVTSYALTINHPDFMENTSLPAATIPQDDVYPIVAVRDPEWQGNYTMNTDFDDNRVYNEVDFFNLFPKWQCGIQPYNITYDALNDYDIVLGNVTYVAADEEIPPHDYHTVFLLDEVEGVTNQIDNATNASGIILMNNISTLIFQQAENYNIPIVRINTEDDPNHQNLTLVKQLLENNSIVIADNTIYDNKITFVYNLSSPECGPNHDYVILYNATNPDDWFLRGIMDIIISCDAHYIHNHFSLIYDCKGIMIYDDRVQNCHMMYNQFIDTPRFNSNLFPMFALPGFSVNETIGKFLWNHSGEPDNTIDGHVNQIHYKETEENPGVEAYNVEADLHITQSPNDAVVILSSRYDGMWGECSGDSAAGNGIIMGIAKYMQELNQSGIKPKYNITFLMTTNEENGYYGAQFYNDTHRNDNIILWIGTEQLGFNTGALHNVYKNATHRIIVENITTLLDYNGKTGYSDIHSLTADITGYNNPSIYGNAGIGAEDVVFTERTDCDTILIHKNNDFLNHHHRGLALTQGDVLAPSNFDWNDAYMFYNITWETVKYFLYNPDCWFSNVSYQVVDSPYDDDTINDSINATFTIHTILPNDKIQVIASLWPEYYWEPVTYANVSMNYTVTRANITDTITVTLPPGNEAGNYWLRLSLYNSTGRINLITKISNLEDGYDNSQCYNLSPRDNDPPATPHKPTESATLKMALNEYNYTTNTTDPNQDQIQYEWDWLADTTHQYETTGFYPSGANCTLSHAYNFGEKKCIKIRAIDQYGAASNWSEPLNLFMHQFATFDMTSQDYVAVVSQPSTYYGHIYGNVQEPGNWTWSFIGCSFGAENYTSYTQNTEETFTVLSDYNVVFTVTDVDTSSVNVTRTITTKNLHSEFITNYNGSIPPGNTIAFINQSIGRYSITNQTWDFDDGVRSYEKNPTHVYTTPGVYNVTLTVRDSQSNNDTSYQLLSIHTDETPPEIQLVTHELAINQNWFTVGLATFINDQDSGIDQVSVNITYPDQTYGNYTMVHLFNNVYSYMFNDTDIVGDYNYTIWVIDHENNTNSATGYSFTIPTPPFLLYATTTPDNNTVSNDPWTNVNVTILDPVNTSAFIDWDNSLKGYWPMDSYTDNGVYDNSSYDNFGVFQNGLNNKNIIPGKYGKGLEFDGTNQYVDVGTSNSLDLGSGDFTFMVWEKSKNFSYSKKAMILTNSPAMENWKGYGFGVINNPYLIVSQSSGNNITLQGTTDVTDNTWHHIAYVFRLGEYLIYVDGELDADNGGWMPAKNITNAQHTMIAYDGHLSSWCYFEGLLDEPQLYNRALGWEEINASFNNGINRLSHNFTSLSDGTYSYYAHAIDTTGNQSSTETRQILIDTTPPTITNVTASPHTVGYGYNVTITADVTDTGSGVNNVSVSITYPDETQGNYTMTYTNGDTYQYVFTVAWLTGQYNYTIWATDNTNNTASNSGHHFHVSAEATISIATLKNSYSGTQYINITDPPNPPENLTIVDRGLTWNTYYNTSSGENILETFQGPVNYQEDNDTWTPINNTITQLPSNHPAYVYGYRTGNDHGLYGVYFKSNAQNEWPVAFTYNRSDDPTVHVIRSKLVGVGYVDPQNNWAYQYLQNAQSSQGQTNDYSITYPGVFTGTDITWSYGNTGLKEEITMSNTTKTVLQNHPPSQYGLNNASSYLVFITKLDYQNLNLYNGSGLLDGNVTISDAGVDFKDVLGQFKCALPLGEAYELNNESMRQRLTYRIVHLNGNTYLLSGLKIADLNAMTFPVVIDPTLNVYSQTNDGYIYNSNSNYYNAWTALTGTISSTATYLSIGQSKVASFPADYRIYRGFLPFNTSSLPSNAIIDNATLTVYKKDDYSTTDFDITIQNGQPTYPHNPLQAGDYGKGHYSGKGGSLNTSRFLNGQNNITLSNLDWINKTGLTKLCLHSSRDISGTTPTGSEYVNVYSADALVHGYKPKLIIAYRNQSKIKNTGSTDIKGYLLIQVQFYNTSQAKWVLDNDTVNETSPRTINSGNQLGLDTVFNGKIRASNLQHGAGTYRVYAALRDSEGNILKTNSGTELKAWWQFSKT